MQIRPAGLDDIADITRIYGHEVAHGSASFETTPPDIAEMTNRWRTVTGAGFPYLVAEIDGACAGYAYVGAYHRRPAYSSTIETSIYVDQNHRGMGVGRALLDALIAAAEQLGYRQMIAVIGDSGNDGSIGLHRAAGFTHVGTLRNVGFKHGRWLDVVLMQRAIGAGSTTPPTIPTTG